jgi:hypothetical protein
VGRLLFNICCATCAPYVRTLPAQRQGQWQGLPPSAHPLLLQLTPHSWLSLFVTLQHHAVNAAGAAAAAGADVPPGTYFPGLPTDTLQGQSVCPLRTQLTVEQTDALYREAHAVLVKEKGVSPPHHQVCVYVCVCVCLCVCACIFVLFCCAFVYPKFAW